MLSNAGHRLLILFCLIVLIGNAVVSYRSLASVTQANEAVLKSEETIIVLERTISATTDAETNQRGFLITGDEGFLERYSRSVARSRENLERLRQLTAGDTAQSLRMELLKDGVDARFMTLDANIALYREKGIAGVQSVGMFERGRAEMRAVRDSLDSMVADAQQSLDARVSEAESSGQRALVTFTLANLLVLALLAFVYYLIRRDIARRQAAEEELRMANERLEQRVKERTSELEDANTELERSNRELQDFAFVASHDLQEPLRKIQAFGDRLKSKQSAQLGDEGRNYLERMQNAAGRMQTLINDLLTFSRVTTKAQPFTRVSLGKIVNEVVGDLETRIQQTEGVVQIGGLPTIEADPLQMRQLFQNLIGNSLKFHRPDAPPVVRVNSVGTENGTCRISVEDNGIGFDEKYLDRIFTPFQRLHARGEYEGTGIGLAVCRKIVERHGGAITAESTPGKGTNFIFTLPVKQNDEE